MPEVTTLLRPVLAPVLAAIVVAWVALAVVPMTGFWTMWVAMSVAMMMPSATRPLARAAAGSPVRGMAFSLGYVSVWVAAGAPALLLLNAVSWTPAWLAGAWLVAGAYQLTPFMRSRLSTCSSIPFHGDPVRYGLRQGWRCVLSCGPLMLAVSVTAMALPHLWLTLALMLVMTMLVCWQKRSTTSTRAVAAAGLVMLLAAGIVWSVAGSGGPLGHDMSRMTSASPADR